MCKPSNTPKLTAIFFIPNLGNCFIEVQQITFSYRPIILKFDLILAQRLACNYAQA